MTESEKGGGSFADGLTKSIILAFTILVPILVLPERLDNPFRTPKLLLIQTGAALLLSIYVIQFLRGKPVLKSNASTPLWMLLLIFLHFMSFLYTGNAYHTKIAAVLNVSCLLFFYFFALHADRKFAFWFFVILCATGILISGLTYLQFGNIFLVFRWARPGTMVMGTIGNSNYLGPYLLVILYAVAAMFFLLKGKLRFVALGVFIFIFGAFLCSRARASWLGFGFSFPIFLITILKVHGISFVQDIKKYWKRVLTVAVSILLLGIILWSIAPKRFHDMMKFEQWAETSTIKHRWKFYQASWRLFMQSPIYGTGLWSFRNMVYETQAEINLKDPGFFKDYVEPKPRRVHNEYLEILNDGGLILAGSLMIFLIMVMKHGYRVIKNNEILVEDKIVVTSALSCVVGIMVAAWFFFPFRVSTPLFMTCLMLGIIDGVYIHNFQLITETRGVSLHFRHIGCCLMLIVLLGIIYFSGWKPLMGELEHFRYKEALAKKDFNKAESHILKAISYDPHNSAYCLYAGRLYMGALRDYVKASQYVHRAIVDFNGDLTGWGAHYLYGIIKLKMGSLFEAREAFKKAMYYNPNFQPAERKLIEVEAIIKKHDKVLVKYR